MTQSDLVERRLVCEQICKLVGGDKRLGIDTRQIAIAGDRIIDLSIRFLDFRACEKQRLFRYPGRDPTVESGQSFGNLLFARKGRGLLEIWRGRPWRPLDSRVNKHLGFV